MFPGGASKAPRPRDSGGPCGPLPLLDLLQAGLARGARGQSTVRGWSASVRGPSRSKFGLWGGARRRSIQGGAPGSLKGADSRVPPRPDLTAVSRSATVPVLDAPLCPSAPSATRRCTLVSAPPDPTRKLARGDPAGRGRPGWPLVGRGAAGPDIAWVGGCGPLLRLSCRLCPLAISACVPLL